MIRHGGRRLHPAQVIVIAYGVVLLVGTCALMLPVAAEGPGRASPVEALFTAGSAVFITGLVVVDTPTYWSPFGHGVIVVLLQVGGLGVMSFASMLGIAVMRRIGLRSKLSAANEAKSDEIGDVRSLVAGIVKTSMFIE